MPERLFKYFDDLAASFGYDSPELWTFRADYSNASESHIRGYRAPTQRSRLGSILAMTSRRIPCQEIIQLCSRRCKRNDVEFSLLPVENASGWFGQRRL